MLCPAFNHAQRFKYPIATYPLTLGAGEIDGITLNADTAESVGSNLVTDSGFDAVTEGSDVFNDDFSADNSDSKGTGWSHDAGNSEFDCNGSQAGKTNLVFNGKVATGGVCYLVEWEVANYGGGTATIALGGAGYVPSVSANGTYAHYVNELNSDTNVYIQGNADFVGSIKNVSIKPITFTHWTTTLWKPQAASGALTGKALKHAGTADDLEQNISAVASTIYRNQFTVTRYTGTLTPQVGGVDGTAISASGTYSEDLTATTTGNLKLHADDAFYGTIDLSTARAVTNPKQNGITTELHRDSERVITSVTTAGSTEVKDDSSVDLYGSELVSNGNMESWSSATNLDDWAEYKTGTSTVNRDAVDQDTGTYCCRIDIDGSNSNVGIYNSETILSAEKTYRVTVRMKGSTSFAAQILQAAAAFSKGEVGLPDVTTAYQTFSYDFIAATDATNIMINRKAGGGGAGESLYVDNVSIKEVPEKTLIAIHDSANLLSVFYDSALVYSGTVSDASIINNKRHYVATGEGTGDFSVERLRLGSELVTDGDMPNTDNWDQVDAQSDLSIVGGKLKILNTDGTAAGAKQTGIATSAGNIYKVSVDLDISTGSSADVDVNIGAFAYTTTNTYTSDGTYTFYFIADADDTEIQFRVDGTDTHYILVDNVSIKQVSP